MCRSVSDILTVFLLARWTMCDSELQIVPLFETIEDLMSAPTVLEKLSLRPFIKNTLLHVKCPDGHDRLFGQ